MASATHSFSARLGTMLPLLGCLAAFSACSHLGNTSSHKSNGQTSEANPTLEQDVPYRDAVETFTERFEIINNFKTDNIIQVTLLHPKLVRRISARHKCLFQDEKEVFPSATDKFSFVVSLYSRDDDASDLRNKNYWNVQIFNRGNAYEPVLAQELKSKSRWTPFFPHIQPWSREYLVVFDVPLVASPKAAMVKPETTTLRISSATGKVAIPYPY